MHINDILGSGQTTLSFEFFPPRHAEVAEKLAGVVARLEVFQPAFVSVTYGAGGGAASRRLTRDCLAGLRHLDPIPHLTCIGHQRAEIRDLLEHYARAGIGNLLALRGDPLKDAAGAPEDFRYAADLVRMIREFRDHPDRRGFGIGVAGFPEGHPATPNRLKEMDFLKAKVDAGADFIITQLFFDNRDFYDYRARCELAGIRVPILPGILPVTTLPGLHRMADLAGGTRVPAKLLKRLQRAQGDPESVRQIGLHYATEQCADLLHQGIPGLHLYTLNQAAPAETVLSGLGLSPVKAAA
jgi:methylenetetrahydrofolate reductase (NADPH)